MASRTPSIGFRSVSKRANRMLLSLFAEIVGKLAVPLGLDARDHRPSG